MSADPIAERLKELAERMAHGEPAVIECPTYIAPEVAPDPVEALRRQHRRLVNLADHVTAEAVDLPEAIVTRVIDDELLAESLLSSADPEWTKAQQIAEDAWRDQLDDARSVRSDWVWAQ